MHNCLKLHTEFFFASMLNSVVTLKIKYLFSCTCTPQLRILLIKSWNLGKNNGKIFLHFGRFIFQQEIYYSCNLSGIYMFTKSQVLSWVSSHLFQINNIASDRLGLHLHTFKNSLIYCWLYASSLFFLPLSFISFFWQYIFYTIVLYYI